MSLYAVTATAVHHTKDNHCRSWSHARQLPTFYLDSSVQGIVDEKHAEEIARDILMPFDFDYESVEIHICVVKL